MLSDEFALYNQETVNLARSIVLKVNIQNTLINDYLRANGRAVSSDPGTWKYNLNLNGEYYSTDTPMTVISSDTQASITFNKATLATHPRTLLKYSLGGEGYKELVAAYPKQRILINGITRPVDMAVITQARDFKILRHDSRYVAGNETSLMMRIQSWIDNYVSRWWNPDYCISDPLYPSAFIAIMRMQLIPAIQNIRLSLVHTGEASAFHVWTYLGGNYGLDEFRHTLSTKQAVWLYRNMTDIRRNAGKAERMDELLKVITKPRGVSMSKVDFIQSDQNLVRSRKREVSFAVTPIASQKLDYASGNLLSVNQIYQDTSGEATYNTEELALDILDISKSSVANVENKLPTKIVRADEDGTVVSSTVANLPTKMSYWAYLSSLGKYTATFAIPIPGSSDALLNAQDAFLLFVYAINKSSGIETNEIPKCKCNSVVPVTYPTFAQLRPLATSDIVDADIVKLLSNVTLITDLSGKAQFSTFVDNILNQDLRNEIQVDSKRLPFERSQIEDLAAALYTDVEVSFASAGSTYKDWFVNQGIDKFALTEYDWYELAISILKVVVDYTDTSAGLGPTQKDMVEIVNRLTSYDVMFLEGLGSNRGQVLNMPFPLMYDVKVKHPLAEYIVIGRSVTDESGRAIKTKLAGEAALASNRVELGDPIVDTIMLNNVPDITVETPTAGGAIVDLVGLNYNIVNITHTVK